MIRKIVAFVVAAGLFGGGLYMVFDSVFVAPLGGISIRLVGIAAFFILIGGVWLWTDYIAPLWRRQSGQRD